MTNDADSNGTVTVHPPMFKAVIGSHPPSDGNPPEPPRRREDMDDPDEYENDDDDYDEADEDDGTITSITVTATTTILRLRGNYLYPSTIRVMTNLMVDENDDEDDDGVKEVGDDGETDEQVMTTDETMKIAHKIRHFVGVVMKNAIIVDPISDSFQHISSVEDDPDTKKLLFGNNIVFLISGNTDRDLCIHLHSKFQQIAMRHNGFVAFVEIFDESTQIGTRWIGDVMSALPQTLAVGDGEEITPWYARYDESTFEQADDTPIPAFESIDRQYAKQEHGIRIPFSPVVHNGKGTE